MTTDYTYMVKPMDQAEAIIETVTTHLQAVPGLRAVVLGGSRARGTATPTSDIDLGLYYHASAPPDLEALGRVTVALDDAHRPDVLTPLGAWGPWINGGGWLVIGGLHVDFLFRDLQKVGAVVQACRAGQVEVAYQPGHPLGFVSAMYLAEVAVCRPLWEAGGAVAQLKALACPYPPGLKRALVEKFAWEAGFSLDNARKSAARQDAAYVAGCCFRSVGCLLQVLFALNEHYWLNEKGAVAVAGTFARRPADFRARAEAVFAHLAPEAPVLEQALTLLAGLVRDVRALAADSGALHG